MTFSSFSGFMGGTILFPVVGIILFFKFFFDLLAEYLKFDFDFEYFLSNNVGGWKEYDKQLEEEEERELYNKSTTCAWCSKDLEATYYYPNSIGDKPGRRYCSKRCLSEDGY